MKVDLPGEHPLVHRRWRAACDWLLKLRCPPPQALPHVADYERVIWTVLSRLRRDCQRLDDLRFVFDDDQTWALREARRLFPERPWLHRPERVIDPAYAVRLLELTAGREYRRLADLPARLLQEWRLE